MIERNAQVTEVLKRKTDLPTYYFNCMNNFTISKAFFMLSLNKFLSRCYTNNYIKEDIVLGNRKTQSLCVKKSLSVK